MKIEEIFERVVHGIVITGIVIGLVFAISMTVFAATSSTQSEATQAEELNPYRAIILGMSDEERVELEQILNLEAGIDTFEGRLATLQVMMNRIITPGWPNNFHDVLSQPGQYTTWKRRHTATPGEKESDVIAYACDAAGIEDFPIGYDRIFQDCKPIGRNPIKVGKQYFGR